MTERRYDVIVLGVGAMGASTLDALAQRGVDVLGIERFGIPHDQGSSGGETRLIRLAYYEHPDYVPLLRGAYSLWEQLEARTHQRVLFRTGIAQIGRPDGETLAGARRAAKEHGLRFDTVSSAEAERRWPTLRVPSGCEAAWDGDGGFVLAGKSIRLFVECALNAGAEVRTGEPALRWNEDKSGVTVETERARYFAKRLIVTAGSWAGPLLPNLNIDLTVTRQTLFWTWPESPELFSLANHPCWFAEIEGHPGVFYGFPMLSASDSAQLGFKIAHHAAGAVADPDHVAPVDVREFEPIRAALGSVFSRPLGAVIGSKVCRYTSTIDQHFVIDRYPGSEKVTLACGFSGHGFKFASVMGEVLADLSLTGKTDWPVEFLRLRRFY